MSALPAIEAYPDRLQQRGGSGDLVGAEYLDVITNAITHHPRSLQTRIGPSEVSHPCARRIGYKLAGTPECNDAGDAWLPTIGTGVHSWLEDAFTEANRGDDNARWLTEARVSVGEILGTDITGSCDLYDRATATVIDHKIVGPSTLRKYKSQGPGGQYRGQIHLYGRGYTRRGLPVDRVMIAFLPRNSALSDAHIWHEPYDETIAVAALQRAEGIALTVGTLGPQAPAVLPTADAYCTRCPWYRANTTDLPNACPGDPGARIPHSGKPALTIA